MKLKKVDNLGTTTSTANTSQIKTTANPTTTAGTGSGSYNTMLEEMKKVQLKKVEKVETSVIRPKMNHDERDFISNALSQAINHRRQQLTKNDNSETSSCEWSD